MLRSRIPFIFALLVVLVASVLYRTVGQGQSTDRSPDRGAEKLPADPQIAAALMQVSAQRIQANIEKLVSFQPRLTLSAQDPGSIRAGQGIGAAREWIKDEFERYSHDCGGCLEVKTDSFTEGPADRIPQPTLITNVYAVLKGADPESSRRMVLVTGHYDSRNSDTLDVSGIAPGANDDGSGTAVSLECARVLSKLKVPATIIFLTVAGEEQGLNGSSHFAKMAKEQGWDIEAALNNDIVGGDRNSQQNPTVVRVFSEGVPVAATDADLRLIRNLGGGDHYSFNQQGYAAVRFTEYREDYHHQHQNVRTQNGIEYGDVPKWVNFDYVANVARINAATLASLASAPAPPTKVRLQTKELENSSTITWDASPGSPSYEVLWRGTTSPQWEHMQTIGNVTRTTLPMSKDNVIFAVRAVDRDGRRSLPVVPEPER